MANPIDLGSTRRRIGDPDPLAPEPRSEDPPLRDDELRATDRETAALALREAAWVRYETFSSSGPQDLAIDCGDDFQSHDFDHCGTVRMREPVLFQTETAKDPAIMVADVNQDGLGDCSFMAVLAGLASKPEGRAQLRSMIAENKDQSGRVVSYTVTLHRPIYLPGLYGRFFNRPLFSTDTKIKVEPEYAKGHALARADGGQTVVWPLVIEKAYGIFFGGYNAIARGKPTEAALQALTGDRGKFVDFTEALHPADDLEQALASGKIVTIDTQVSFDEKVNPYNLVSRHTYLVTGIAKNEAGKPCLQLHNPWNYEEPSCVPIEDMRRWFRSAQIGSVHGGATQ